MALKIHPSAVIDKTAILEDGVEIGPFVVIGPKTKIGSGTKIGPHCVLEHCEIGKNNEFIASAFIGMKPQDLSYKAAPTMVVIGGNNQIRECVTIHRATTVEHPTKIGSGGLFMGNTHIAHDCVIGDGVIIVNNSGFAGHVIIEDKAVISGYVGAHQFCRIGTLAMVSGSTGVHKDIAPYCTAQGYRAGLVGLNLVGLRRAGMNRDTVKSIKDIYRILFMSHLNMSDAVLQAEAQAKTPEAKHMVEFCKNSKRGMAIARMNMTAEDDE